MNLQTVIVLLIIVVALLYIARSLWRLIRRPRGASGCAGCSACQHSKPIAKPREKSRG
ncbi:FeoB-associated Cys-rich membrane protein [uncultured Porphyromonas sp.]|uniref:FeoB-associated Cys-rich membrane protein n=1 Tax=uncultured Porphyromonas sp. TaxID=159274 RepID=UPI0026262595|nr:FeoB-associated Cys-rich membrane protein [uncultured Porphyromonas sp.]